MGLISIVSAVKNALADFCMTMSEVTNLVG